MKTTRCWDARMCAYSATQIDEISFLNDLLSHFRNHSGLWSIQHLTLHIDDAPYTLYFRKHFRFPLLLTATFECASFKQTSKPIPNVGILLKYTEFTKVFPKYSRT